MNKRLSILEVVEACGAGSGRHVRTLCEDLAAQGHQVTIAYSPYRADEAFEGFISGWQDRIHFVPIKVGREVSPVSDLRGVADLLLMMRREGPFDVIHGHSSKAGAIARIAGRLLGIPTLYTPHSLILASPELSRFEAAVYGLVERMLGHWATSKMIAVSEDEREFILKHRLVLGDRVVTIPNAVEDQDLHCFPVRGASEGFRQKPLTFGAAMRFSAQKAPMNLVEAFVMLSDALPEVPTRLVIAGDGELFPEVRGKVEESGISDKISLLGWTPDTRKVLRELDIFIVSSLYEGFSYSILEAMAAGLPIVTTDVFGTRETVSRITGNMVVRPGDPKALADGMKQMATLDTPESLRKSLRGLGQRNHDYVRMHFRESEVTRLTSEAYWEVCRQDGRG
jgi:glycosyltransferase involved in cell wall biosynthesis